MRKFLLLLLAGSCGVAVWAQTNLPAPAAAPTLTEDGTGLSSEHLSFDGVGKLIYFGNVWVTNAQGKLTCERLTIDLPKGSGEHPTNVVAETNVVVDAQDKKGKPQHITADMATYSYHVVNMVTNEFIVFTNNPGSTNSPKFENDQIWQTGDSITYDCLTKGIQIENPVTHIKQTHGAGGTNSSPLDFLK